MEAIMKSIPTLDTSMVAYGKELFLDEGNVFKDDLPGTMSLS